MSEEKTTVEETPVVIQWVEALLESNNLSDDLTINIEESVSE